MDFGEKKGQIAHLDRNPANNELDNLAWLCFDHHDQYDSRTSQSKGLTIGEVKRYRGQLYQAVEEMRVGKRPPSTESPSEVRAETSVGELTILYDETRHRFKERNNQCQVYRIGLQNRGRTTVKNVAVKITSITAAQDKQNDELRKYVDLEIGLSVNPFGEYSHPNRIPESSVILHPGEEAIFDFVRLCIIPGNYSILHSRFFENPQTSHLFRRPRGVLSPGEYTIAISAQSDNLNPIEQRFEISSSSKSVTFRPV